MRLLMVTRHQQIDELVIVGECSGFIFGIHEFAINHNVEDSPSIRNKPRFNTQRLFDFGSQTGRLRLVVSLSAVCDRNIHISEAYY